LEEREIQKSIITCSVTNSACSTMSHVSAFAREFIEQFFPEDFFQSFYITTSSISNEQSQFEDDNNIVKQLPQLSINPVYLPDYDDVFGGPFPMWRRNMYQRFSSKDRYGYKHIFLNDEDNISISVIPQRIKFQYEYKIKCDSYLHKIDIVHQLRQKLNSNDIFYWNNVVLESQIPNTIIQSIAEIKKFDLTEETDKNCFLNYLKQFSGSRIESKIYTGTGNLTFTHLYSANILIKVESPPNVDGNTKERETWGEGDPIIDFSLTMELWIPNNYKLECNSVPSKKYYSTPNESKITVEHVFKLKPPSTKGERSLITWTKFITDVNTKIDKIDISTILNKELIRIIDESIEDHDIKFLDELFEFVLYRNEIPIEYNKEFKFNWETKEIILLNPYLNYVYNLGIYVDQAKLHDYIEHMKS